MTCRKELSDSKVASSQLTVEIATKGYMSSFDAAA
jgi:hypothetical protein